MEAKHLQLGKISKGIPQRLYFSGLMYCACLEKKNLVKNSSKHTKHYAISGLKKGKMEVVMKKVNFSV